MRAVQVGRAAALELYPNPARHAVQATGVAAGAAVDVFDALNRPLLRATADAIGSLGQAQLMLPVRLPAGMYVVRSGCQTCRCLAEE